MYGFCNCKDNWLLGKQDETSAATYSERILCESASPPPRRSTSKGTSCPWPPTTLVAHGSRSRVPTLTGSIARCPLDRLGLWRCTCSWRHRLPWRRMGSRGSGRRETVCLFGVRGKEARWLEKWQYLNQTFPRRQHHHVHWFPWLVYLFWPSSLACRPRVDQWWFTRG
jgi:hypothetical protein